jgi:hypothetical protein
MLLYVLREDVRVRMGGKVSSWCYASALMQATVGLQYVRAFQWRRSSHP